MYYLTVNRSIEELIGDSVCPECGNKINHMGGCCICSNPGCGWELCH